MPKSSQKGFVIIFPVIVVAAVLLLGVTVSNFKKQSSAVLSESTSGGSSNSDDDEDESSTPKPSESSKPAETAKPGEPSRESPKPSFFGTTKTLNFKSKVPEPRRTVKPSPKSSPKPDRSPKPQQTIRPELNDSLEFDQEESKPLETEDAANATASPEASGGEEFRVLISKNQNGSTFSQTRARVTLSDDLPVNTDNETLTVETPNGQEVVGLAPDDAVQNVIDSGSVSGVSSDPSTGLSELKLTVNSNGVPVYEMKGSKEAKFLGVFNVKINKTVQISAVDGAEGSVTISGFDRFLDLFSF